MNACHTCDVRSCINPDHLWEGSVAENQADMVQKNRSLRGERHNMAKLTASDVVEIRKLCEQRMSQREIASRFCVSPNYISDIRVGKVWKDLPV